MRLPTSGGRIDLAATEAMFSRAIEHGCNYFDTAYMYHGGESEKAVGAILSKRRRDTYFLADKMPVWMARTEDGLARVFQEQLDRTKAGYFDFYLVHSLSAGNWDLAKKIHTMEFLERMKKEGRIRHIGFSFHDTPEAIERIVKDYDWEFAQIQLNYLDWTNYRSKEQYEIVDKAGLPVVVMEPLRGGTLASLNPTATEILKRAAPSASVASWAFRYAASLPRVLTVLSGMSAMGHLDDNLKTFSPLKPLDDSEREILTLAVAAYRNTLAIPCTGCRYCQPCPAGVQIADIFNRYNQYKVDGNAGRFRRYYEGLPEEGRASECVDCKKCVKVCPQMIDIPARLKEIDADYRAMIK